MVDNQNFVKKSRSLLIVTHDNDLAKRCSRIVKIKDGKLIISKTANAANPIINGMKPILGCDVWEHSYYVDYKNRRPEYLNAFFDKLVNWEFVSSQLD